MKTDRELLELAAKAAGYKVTWNEHWDCFAHVVPINTTNPPTLSGLRHAWQPLEDDGDAFRLAIYLDLFGTPVLSHCLSVLSFLHVYDKYALMRRAIVMAAAKIGEGME